MSASRREIVFSPAPPVRSNLSGVRALLTWFRRKTTAFLVAALLIYGTRELLQWQAEHRWQLYAAEARKRGVKLTVAELAPPPIPDVENFAMLPMFQKAMGSSGRVATDPFALPQDRKLQVPHWAHPPRAEKLNWNGAADQPPNVRSAVRRDAGIRPLRSCPR